MAWNDETLDLKKGPARRAIDLDPIDQQLGQSAQSYAATAQDTGARLRSMTTTREPAGTGSASFEPAEFAMNSKTGEIALPNGSVVKATAPLLLQIATLQNDDGAPLPRMQAVPKGFRPMSLSEIKKTVDAIPTESDFWGEAYANGKTTLGLMASAVDSMFGNDDPNNSWSNASRELENDQSIGQIKASRGRWYSSFDSFLNGLGQTAGNVGGTILGAVPVAGAAAAAGAASGGGVGSIPGGALGAGLALSGGAAAYGEQATDFYTSALAAMEKMSPGALEQESPLYRQVIRDNPGINHDDAMREVAIQGARAAGTAAGVLGAAEGVVGGKLAGNLLARMGASRALLGPAMDAVAKRAGVGATAGRIAGRTVGGGAAAAGEEMAESMLGQSAGAAYTGVGSDNPMDYANADEGWAAALGGGIFGALGGRSRAVDPVSVAQNSDIAQALVAEPNANREWSQRMEPSQEQLMLPAVERQPLGRPMTQAQPAPVPPEQRQQVLMQLDNVLSQRFGPDWADNIDAVAQDPGGRQLVGQIMAIEREVSAEQGAPAYQRGYAQEPIESGQPAPGMQGEMFGGRSLQEAPQQAPAQQMQAPPEDPNQQMLPLGNELPQEEAPAAPPSLAERRSAQAQRQEEMQRMSEQSPQALPQEPSRALEQQIFDAEDQITDLEAAISQRPARDPRLKFLRQALKEQQASLAALEQQWQEARNAEGPQGVAPANRVDAPEPAAAPQERMPDDRPMGVAPAPMVNPEPMSPEEAQSRAQTQADRAGGTATPEQVQAAAQSSQEQVSPSTPEPSQDLVAQVQAMNDPSSQRDAVFIADGQLDAPAMEAMAPNTIVVRKPGVGTLLTTSKQKAQAFRRAKRDADIQKILGYSEDKSAVMASGQEPTVVQARTPEGAVAAEQVATPARAAAARKAVAKQAPKGAKVVQTTVAAAQARRAAAAEQTPRRAAAAIATSKERSTPKRKPAKPKKADDETTRDERALAQPGAPREAAAPAAATADTIERAATRKPESVAFKGKQVPLATTLARRSGNRGANIDLRVDALDSEAASRVGTMLRTGTLNPVDRAKAEAYLRDHKQLKSMLDAAVTAAEDRLRPVMEKAGAEFTREAEKRQLELEQVAGGERRAKPRTSPLAYLPLVPEESRGFLKAVRAEAKAELKGGYQPSKSVARQMINGISGKWEAVLANENQGKQVLQVFANMTDEQMESVLQSTHQLIQDSTVAKQVMRGATEVAHAMRRMEQDLSGSTQSFSLPSFADHQIDGVDRRVLPNATEHGDIPAAARGVVNEWVAQFEKAGNKFSAPLHVMSVADAMKIAPGAFLNGRVPNGKFIRMTDDKGKVSSYVVAVNWDRFASEAAALEVLAHEYGHVVTTELYARADPRTRRAIDVAYDRWMASQQGRSVDDILRSQMPGIERAAFAGGATNRAYATNFWEWAARNAALYVLDPSRPHLSAVEKFFKAIGDVMRKIYTTMLGGRTNLAWEEALDRWVNGSLTLSEMPRTEPANFNHEEFADAREPAGESRSVAQRATAALAPLRDVMSGRATVADVRETMQPLVESKAGDRLKVAGLSLMTMRQIERQYRDTPLGAALSGWVRNQQLKSKTANGAMETGSRWMEQANLLDAKVRTALEKVMYQATHFGINPEVAFTDKTNAHLSRGSDYVRGVNEKRYTGLRDLYTAAVRADPRVADIYAGLRDAFTKIHEDTLAKQLEIIEASNFSDKAKEQIVSRIKAAQAEVRLGPYFPLMRFGNWIVKVQLPAFAVGKGGKEGADFFDTKTQAREEMRNQRALNPGAQVTVERVPDEGKYLVRVYQRGVYFFESEAAAKAGATDIMREVRENYDAQGVDFDEAQAAMEPLDEGDSLGADNAIISQPFKGREGYERTKAGSPEFMQEVRSLVNEKKLDPEIAATLERLAIEALPENNYRQSLLPRQNVFGASQQMLRAYAHRFQGAAHHFAAVEHGKSINTNWQRAWEVNRSYAPAGRVLNTLQANQAALADRMKSSTANTVMNVVTDASSLYSLGFSPAYVLTNALQPWTVTAPTLAGMTTPGGQTVGMLKATKYLREAYAGAIPFFTKRGISDFVNEAKALAGQRGTSAGLQETAKEIITKFGQTDAERRMLESLLERGTLDFSWLNSLEDAMRGGVLGQKWANLQRLGMAMPQQVEAMNRVTTALAAYRLAKDERLTDGSEASLQEFADDTVADTQLDYSRMNRPLAFNKAGFNVILQFKLYMQGMYMLFARNAALALKGTPEEKRQGRRTIAYLLATHAAAAGAAGLGPAAAMAKLGLVAFAAMTPDDDDDWKSGDQLLRDMLTDTLGDYAGTVAEKGLPALLGIDMSDRIGLPVLADSRFANIREQDNTGTTMDKWVLYSLGAPYSNAKRVVQGVADAANGDFSSAVNGLPTAARSIARSAKWAREGIVDKNGDTFVPQDELGWGNIAINSLGLSPLATSRAYSERTEVKQTTARIIEQRKELLQASRTGDDVADRIRLFNASVPKPFRITGKQEESSAKSKAARERGEASKQEAAVRRMIGG